MTVTTGGSGSWHVINSLLEGIPIPRMVKVRQNFFLPGVVDIRNTLSAQLSSEAVWAPLKRGDTVAIGIGSRGIDGQIEAVQTLVSAIKERGGIPFLVPAMGSHAGATAEGQKKMLMTLGMDQVDAPIKSSMETVLLGRCPDGMPILVDRNAHEADHLIIINRVKSHVCFRGQYESGLVKMIAIGLGKQQGAEIAHNLGFGRMPRHIEAIATEALNHLKLLFAVALVEDATHRCSHIEVIPPDNLLKREAELLKLSKSWEARLHFETLDGLIIDEIGKHISGSGFDTNVVGRYHSEHVTGGPKITRVAILDIAAESNGNGNGLGMADFTTVRAVEKFDFAQTYPNTLTALLTGGVKIPMVLMNDRQVLQACMKTSYRERWEEARIVRIRNTLSLNEIEVSESIVPEIEHDPHFEILGEPYELQFNDEGNLF